MQTPATSPAKEESSALFLQREMQDIIKTETGLHDEFAAMIAIALVRGWRKRAGSQTIYIPSPIDFETRNQRLKREFDGTNRAKVCKDHAISRSRLYQIVSE